MTDKTDADVPSTERVLDIPRILRALRDSVEEALLDHKRSGHPVAVWREGRVVWVQPEDIPVSEKSSDHSQT